MLTVDVIAAAFIAVMALWGARSGLARALTFAGFAAGAVAGAVGAPLLLTEGHDAEFALAFALPGALLVGGIFAALTERYVFRLRRPIARIDRIRPLGAIGGALLAAWTGVVAVWLVGAVAVQRDALRDDVVASAVVKRLNSVVDAPGPDAAAERQPFRPFPIIAGPPLPIAPADLTMVRDAQVKSAARKVGRIEMRTCGRMGSGTGWIAGDGIVATNAHVIEWGENIRIKMNRGRGPARPATPIWFDTENDIALLRVPGLKGLRPLEMVERPQRGTSGALLGYPGGRYSIRAARLGRTTRTIEQEIQGTPSGSKVRTDIGGLLVTPVRVRSGPGASGGPVVDTEGKVLTTIFGGSALGSRGFGVPNRYVQSALRKAGAPVSTGTCPGELANSRGR